MDRISFVDRLVNNFVAWAKIWYYINTYVDNFSRSYSIKT